MNAYALIGLYACAFALEGGPALDDADTTDELCCVFARSLDRRVYGRAQCDKAPKALWMLEPEAGDPWGPVSAVVAAGIGKAVPGFDGAGVYRLQGWRGTPFGKGISGHTVTIIVPQDVGPFDEQVVFVFDSAAGRNERAEVWRLGDYLRQFKGGYRLAKFLDPATVGV